MQTIINQHAPEFTVQAFQQGNFKTVSNKDIEGKWALFFFYPADFTFVCPTELEDLSNKYDELQALGVEVFSVSTDSHFVHKAWHDTSDRIAKLKYAMLADPIAVLSALYVASHDGEVCPAKWQEGEETLKPSIDLVGKL